IKKKTLIVILFVILLLPINVYASPLLVLDASEECTSLLGDGEFYGFLQDLFNLIQVMGPILALVFNMLKAVASGEEDMKKKAFKNTGTRLTSAVLLYLIPALLTFVFSLVDSLNGSTCDHPVFPHFPYFRLGQNTGRISLPHYAVLP